MKILKKVRLINWHRFPNETIEFGRATLLSGENGAGKSTVLDAIQFVVTCSKANFNKAAHEKGKRNLNSYIRCKTGKETHPYERTGELSAHICLEFYDEAKEKSFLIGVVMDSQSEEKEPNTAWYLMEDRVLSDALFFNGNRIKGIQAFRTNKGIRKWAPTLSEARAMILSRFGRLNEKFFSLIPKAMAFKPIRDIKEFVYSYVLDEREVNIDTLRENVRSYQELERMLEDVRCRITELELIRNREEETQRYITLDKSYEYYIARAEQDMLSEQLARTEEAIRRAEQQLSELIGRIQEQEASKRAKDEMVHALEAELSTNSEYRALHEFERRASELKARMQQDRREIAELKACARKAAAAGTALLGAMQETGLLAETAEDSEDFRKYLALLPELEHCSELSELSLHAERAASFRQQAFQAANRTAAECSIELQKQKTELSEVRHRVTELREHRFIYPRAVNELRQKVQEELQHLGRTTEARVLCELLEISNPAWQNAVEGYLHTQRFYILVEPEDYDLAVSVYDRLREAKRVYGVGLINTGKLEEYDEIPKDSLAETVSSKNIWARRYINMVLGKVHRCGSYRELKNYPTAITRQCMRYQNHVVSAIKPEIYETPFIGAEAIRKQLQDAEARMTQLEECCRALQVRIAALEAIPPKADAILDHEVKNRLRSLEVCRAHESELASCNESIKKLKKNETLIQKSIQLEELKTAARQIEEAIRRLYAEQGRATESVARDKTAAQQLQADLERQRTYAEKLGEKLWESFSDAETEYQKLRKGKDPSKLREDYDRARKGNQTRREKAETEMIRAMQAYKSAHDFGAADSLLGYPEFAAEYDKLKNSQLLEYEEKVYRARNAAEEEFREQFLSKLQENIRQARQDFKELNRALSEISFDREQYEFIYEPRSAMKKYYTMIMDERNIGGNDSIFGASFMSEHKEVMDELFNKLALDNDENTDKVLEEYTDYRTYMDYDIRIVLPDGSYMLYSKVSAEKSGGETQSPFYITVAASFIQLYKGSIGGDAVGLMMMDEAFNNMDDERMGSVLAFLTNPELKLQLLIAAPPGKIQTIGKYTDRILLAMPDANVSFIEDFTNETLR